MENAPLATASPEVDATEDQKTVSSIPDNSAAHTGASVGEHCTTDRPTSSALTPIGTITKFESTDVYVSKPSSYPSSPAKLLLLLTGGTGVHSKNNQLQADKFAEEGYVVVMPDQFNGDPAPNSVPTPLSPIDEKPSILDQVKMRAAEAAKSFLIDMWLARHTSEKVLPLIASVLRSAKEEYADAVESGNGVYAVGYCFGAKYVLILAGKASEDQAPSIKAGAIAHATLVTEEDIRGVVSPVSMACVENDQLFPEEILEKGRKNLEQNKVEYEVKMYPDVPHGFAVVGHYDDPKIKEAQSTAFDQMLAWLKAH